MILPQIIRKENRKFSTDILRDKTRSLLAFSLLNRYPVWGTRLLFSEYRKLLKYIDRFGGVGSADFNLSSITLDQGDLDVAVYQRGRQKLIVVVNVDHNAIELSEVELLLAGKFGKNIYLVDSENTSLQPSDYLLFADGDWYK